ncbi:hypothetical protein Cob_v012546 [Colletotrichum orbiculare MAFF 240422]|uniref:Uncharacterized protein n=1 Tax=Colletotrichum orbiculare (strain 104-T / ATCC 96160 / CBS 514.97 / LARS 414 / MAFF 240422) TaxID=1213857 RepID=N4VG78_COLOR|nr:hypothetical protein Cob_v012546 [Colletotrichum orbiculare MAFF 240422]
MPRAAAGRRKPPGGGRGGRKNARAPKRGRDDHGTSDEEEPAKKKPMAYKVTPLVMPGDVAEPRPAPVPNPTRPSAAPNYDDPLRFPSEGVPLTDEQRRIRELIDEDEAVYGLRQYDPDAQLTPGVDLSLTPQGGMTADAQRRLTELIDEITSDERQLELHRQSAEYQGLGANYYSEHRHDFALQPHHVVYHDRELAHEVDFWNYISGELGIDPDPVEQRNVEARRSVQHDSFIGPSDYQWHNFNGQNLWTLDGLNEDSVDEEADAEGEDDVDEDVDAEGEDED